MKHMVFRYLRKPVAAITLSAIIPGAYDGMAVICDDGAFFYSWPDGDKQREWLEGSPIPGTVRHMNRGGKAPINEDILPLEAPDETVGFIIMPPVKYRKSRDRNRVLALRRKRTKEKTSRGKA